MNINRFVAKNGAQLLLIAPFALLVGVLFFAQVAYPLLSNYLFISYLGVNSTPIYYAWIAWVLAIGSSLLFAAVAVGIVLLLDFLRRSDNTIYLR